jgi:hypothetical protein
MDILHSRWQCQRWNIGDIFDIAWKANRRNYALLTQNLEHPHRNNWRDWLFLAGVALVVCAIFAVTVRDMTAALGIRRWHPCRSGIWPLISTWCSVGTINYGVGA